MISYVVLKFVVIYYGIVLEKYYDRIEFGAGLKLNEGFGRDVLKIGKILPEFRLKI